MVRWPRRAPHSCELQQRQQKGAPRAAKGVDLDGERRLRSGPAGSVAPARTRLPPWPARRRNYSACCRLEGDLIVDRFVEAGLARPTAPGATTIALARRAEVAMLVVLHRCAGPATAAIEHGQRTVEALQHHFRRIAVLAVLALPLARLQLALDVNLGALLQVLLGDAAQTLVENHHRMPLCLLAALAGRLVAPAIRRCHAQIGDRTAVLRATDLGIPAEIADQYDFVDGTGHKTLLLRPCCRSAASVDVPAVRVPLCARMAPCTAA